MSDVRKVELVSKRTLVADGVFGLTDAILGGFTEKFKASEIQMRSKKQIDMAYEEYQGMPAKQLSETIRDMIVEDLKDENGVVVVKKDTLIDKFILEDVKKVQGKEVINLRGTVIPLVRLNELLDIDSLTPNAEELIVLIAKKGDRFAGLVVDELIGQMEIVIKSMGKYAGNCKLISGATILGDGEVALILDANALI